MSISAKLTIASLLLTGLTGCTGTKGPGATAPTGPAPAYTFRCCLTVQRDGQERRIQPKDKLSSRDIVKLHTQAEGEPAEVVVAGFDPASHKLSGDFPAFQVPLEGNQENCRTWAAGRAPGSINLYVAVCSKGSSDASRMSELLKNVKADGRNDGPPVRMLEESLTTWFGKHPAGMTLNGPETIETGGTFKTSAKSVNPAAPAASAQRSVGANELQKAKSSSNLAKPDSAPPVATFDWRSQATVVTYRSKEPGVVVYALVQQ